MARIRSLSLLVYLFLHFLLGTSHAYQHRHLQQAAIYRDQGQVVEAAGGSQESVAKQQIVDELRRKLDEKLASRSSAAQLLYREGSRKGKEKRWGGHRHRHRPHHDHDGSRGGDDPHSSTFEELQQQLDDLNQAIRSLYDLLSSSFGANSEPTTLSATVTSISSQYNATSTSANSTPIAYPTDDVSSNATATAASSSNHTIASASSTSEPTIAHYAFEPMSSSNVAVYYGQTDQTSNVPLSAICGDRDVDIIILAFINKLSTGPAGLPALNMGARCWAASSAQVDAGATELIDCVGDGFAQQVKSCQDTGKKVLLSIGGAIGYSDTSIASDEDAVRIADNIWNLFGGGMDNDTITAIRPFGDVIFDGFDIDNEDSSLLHWPLLISTLRTHFSQSSAPNNKPYYISAAPQCPRPDASIPLTSMQTTIDFIFIQFYNNPSCNLNSPGFLSSLQAWSDDLSANASPSAFVDIGNGVSGPRVYVGAPSFPAGGSGWIGGEKFSSVMGRVKELGLQNLGGIMLWDGAYGALSGNGDGSYGRTGVGRTYMRLAKDVLEFGM